MTMASKSVAQAREAFMNHGKQVAADGVHLRVEFAADDAVAEIDQARAGIFLDFLGRALSAISESMIPSGSGAGLKSFAARSK